jgi:hypothetical protein
MRNSMSVFQKARLFFGVLIRVLFRTSSQALSQILSEVSAFEKIALSERLYMRVPKAELTLMSLGALGSDVVESMKLSVNEAEQIFRSIKHACDLQDVVEVKIGDLSWKTDARVKSNPDEIIIVFNGPLGYTRDTARREDVAAAIDKFTNRYGIW